MRDMGGDTSMDQTGPRLSREEIEKRESGRTEISPVLAWVIGSVCLATIVSVPAFQSVEDAWGGSRSASGSRSPGWAGISSAFDGVADAYARPEASQSAKIFAANA